MKNKEQIDLEVKDELERLVISGVVEFNWNEDGEMVFKLKDEYKEFTDDQLLDITSD